MSTQYLDKAGATFLVGKIKELLADKIKIESVKVNGTALTIAADKSVDVPVPTALSAFTDDATHRLVTDTEKSTWNNKQAALVFNSTYNASTNKAATMKDVTDAVGQVTGVKFEVVSTLPATGAAGTIYLLAHSHGTQDAYDEYIWVSSKWEKIGSTDVDLSGYVKTTDLVAITDAEITAMFA